MQFSFLAAGALSITTVLAAPPSTSNPFYITVVPGNGSAPFPASIAVVSRGAVILSATKDYLDTFTLNKTDNLIHPTNTQYGPSGSLASEVPILFGSDPVGSDGPSDPWSSVTKGDDVYLVKTSAGTSNLNQWWGQPRDDNFGDALEWRGAQGNAALKISATKPQ